MDRCLSSPAGDLVGLLRAGERNSSAAQRGPGGGVGVGLVGDHPVRTLPWSSWPGAGDRYLLQQREQLRVVPGLTGSQHHRHRQPAAIDGQVQLGRQSAAGPAEGFPFDGEVFDPAGRAAPFFRAPAACW